MRMSDSKALNMPCAGMICLAGWIFIQCKVQETRVVTPEVLEQRLTRTGTERKAEKAAMCESRLARRMPNLCSVV